jgi:zeta-carotene desaturase
MPQVIVAGGGLAGLAATAALADAGFHVDLYEAKPYLGGRATSYSVPFGDGTSATVDNCQHILLRCCTNLLDFYRRLGVDHLITFHREFYFIEPGGRISVFGSGRLPYPLHLSEAFAQLKFLSPFEKAALGRGMVSLIRESSRRDLDEITMADWLSAHGQPSSVVERFWRQVLVSAVNLELDEMAAGHAFQVFRTGFLGGPASFEMGVPDVPLGELAKNWGKWPNVRVHLRSRVERVEDGRATVDGAPAPFDACVVALPWHRAGAVLDGWTPPPIESSPITGVHLWFDRSITDLPHATLLDRTMQWMFNKDRGRYIQCVVSASRDLTNLSRNEIVDIAIGDLRLYFPKVKEAQLLKAHVIKEQRATFSAAPETEHLRPTPESGLPKVLLAGDWTRTGWPATMEGAVRSGYLAAEAVCQAAGKKQRFLVPDIA